MHGGRVMVGGEEMHKSLGNFCPVTAALQRYDPEVIRFFLINVQYRGPIDFTPHLLGEAKRSYARLPETVRTKHAERRLASAKGDADSVLPASSKQALADFYASRSDDFTTR